MLCKWQNTDIICVQRKHFMNISFVNIVLYIVHFQHIRRTHTLHIHTYAYNKPDNVKETAYEKRSDRETAASQRVKW